MAEFAFQFELIPLDCLFEANYHIGLLLYTLTPFLVYLVVLSSCWATSVLTGGRSRPNGLGWCLWIAFLIYPAVTSRIFGTFVCTALDDGRNVLQADMQIDCDAPNHQLASAYAVLMIGIHTIGTPVYYVSPLT